MPAVTSARLTRPSIGAVIRVKLRFRRAASSCAWVAATAALASWAAVVRASASSAEIALLARESIAALLESAAVSYTTEGKPRGCLVDLSTTNFSPANKGVEDYLRDHRRRAARLLRERFARGVADGDVPAGADLDALTSFYSSVLQGLSIQARDGASRQQLLAIGRCAMAAWDSLLAVEAA